MRDNVKFKKIFHTELIASNIKLCMYAYDTSRIRGGNVYDDTTESVYYLLASSRTRVRYAYYIYIYIYI